MASSPSSSVGLPGTPEVQGCVFEPLRVFPIVLGAATHGQRFRHDRGRQVTPLAGLQCSRFDKCFEVMHKWFSGSIATGGDVVTRVGCFGDDVTRARATAGSQGCHGDVTNIRV